MTAPEPPPRADVELTKAEQQFIYDWAPGTPIGRGSMAESLGRILADRLAAVQAERDELRQSNDWNDWACKQNQNLYAETLARAESAEAERDEWKRRRDAAIEQCRHLHQDGKTREQWHLDNCGAVREVANLRAERDDLRARLLAVETDLREKAQGWIDADDITQWGDHSRYYAGRDVLEVLDRAVLASPSTHTQRDTETAAGGRIPEDMRPRTGASTVALESLAQRDTEEES